MVGFIFGSNTNETPETLLRKRKVAEALAIKAGSAPKNVGEGLSAIGNALLYRSLMNKVDAGDAAGRKSADTDASFLFSGMGGPSGSTDTAIPSPSGSDVSIAPSKPINMDGNGVFNDFIDTVKQNGVKNPYALAAIAATGKAESGFSPENVNRTWSDPSESGQPGMAGGIMSWRGPRYKALEATGDLSPAGQAKFFVQEDPQLIASLNNAKSVEEAQGLMNRAWAFKGYDRPGGEAAHRMGLASGFLPMFQGQGGQQVASLDPSAGLPDSSAQTAYQDPKVTTDFRPPMPAAPDAQAAIAAAAPGLGQVDPSQYNTPLSTADEHHFQQWIKKQGREKDLNDYDLRGAWAGQVEQSENGHFPDTFKKPNHPTFSDESQYSNGETKGGKWVEGQNGKWTFEASDFNLKTHSKEDLERYFKEREPGNSVIFPENQNIPASPMPQSNPAVAAALASPQAAQQSALPPLPSSDIGQTPNVAVAPPLPVQQSNPLVAQALAGPQQQTQQQGDGYFPAPPSTPGQTGPSIQQIGRVLQNPYATEEQRAVAQALLKQKMDEQNPDTQINRSLKQAQLDALKAKPLKQWQKLTDTLLFNPETGETKDITGTPPGQAPKFRYQGNSVEAQSLNGLMDTGALTADQAQQLGAGKTITGPNGEIIFMTPQGVFGKPADGGPAQPMSAPQSAPSADGIDLFGDAGNSGAPAVPATPVQAGPSAAAPAIPPTTEAAQEQRPGMIPLTANKPAKPLSENERKNQSLFSVIKPELKVVEDNFDALSNWKNQAASKVPFSEFVTTPEYQKAANSLQTIVSSYLYSVSGATATPDEVKKQTDILTPRPGESKESIESKKKRVRTMVNAVAASGGLPPLSEPAVIEPPSDDLKDMPVPDGMDENTWKFVPPEDRKLWQKK